MATSTFLATLSASLSAYVAPKGDSVAALSTLTGADTTAVEAAVAVLEADGASPTQAHVNSLRTVWNTMKADAIVAAATVPAGGVAVTIDLAQITTRTKLRAALDAVMFNLQGSNLLAP